MRVTKIIRPFALSDTNSLGSGGGLIDSSGGDGQFPGSGQVPTSSGSNGWAWSSNVAAIYSNTSNALLGPFVNFQNGSGITFAVASNTLTIGATLSLDDLSDVTITSPAPGARLRYDGTGWADSALIWRPVMTYDGTNWLVAVDGSGNAIMTEA